MKWNHFERVPHSYKGPKLKQAKKDLSTDVCVYILRAKTCVCQIHYSPLLIRRRRIPPRSPPISSAYHLLGFSVTGR